MDIELFELSTGKIPVEIFIKSLDVATRAKAIRIIDLLEKYGPLLGMPHSKHINKNIFELRVRGNIEVRVFYTFYCNKIILLHAFKKKCQKIPVKELFIAEERASLLRGNID